MESSSARARMWGTLLAATIRGCCASRPASPLSVPDGVKVLQTPDVTLFLWDSRTIHYNCSLAHRSIQ